MCAALQIQIIPASSPQAKGRVERNHGTHQDRLVKKLRRLAIAADGPANVFLAGTYWLQHNARFVQAATGAEDFHRRSPAATALDRVFRLEETRTDVTGIAAPSVPLPMPVVRPALPSPPQPRRPSADHPWSRGFEERELQRRLRQIAR